MQNQLVGLHGVILGQQAVNVVHQGHVFLASLSRGKFKGQVYGVDVARLYAMIDDAKNCSGLLANFVTPEKQLKSLLQSCPHFFGLFILNCQI